MADIVEKEVSVVQAYDSSAAQSPRVPSNPERTIAVLDRDSSELILTPEPSSDPEDPLNWSKHRKYGQFFAICFAGFVSLVSTNCNQLAYVVQAETYKRQSIEVSYGGSAGIAGLLAGPLLITPVSYYIGRSSVMFWCLLGEIACQIWATQMTTPDDYVSFILSRLFCGLFASVFPILGTGFIMDAFFLHQRGRLFAMYEFSFLLGTIVPGTVSGLIVQNLYWTWCFIWTIPVLGFATLLIFLFAEDSNFDREKGTCVRPNSKSWISRRITTIFLGWKVVPQPTSKAAFTKAVRPLTILFSPVSLVPGFFSFLAFGFAIMVVLLMSIYLQTPEAEGGYSFTPERNAYFSFVGWVASIAAWLTAQALSDRLPLLVTRRLGNGVWQPEYRLINMLIPVIVAPISLGIFGSALQYHLHYMVLALGSFLINYAAQLTVPLCVNYVVECYVDSATEVAIAFNVWRLALGLALPFAADPWAAAVGTGWQFGMAAFFVLGGGILLMGIALFGHRVRTWSVMRGAWAVSTEGGLRVLAMRGGKDVA